MGVYWYKAEIYAVSSLYPVYFSLPATLYMLLYVVHSGRLILTFMLHHV